MWQIRHAYLQHGGQQMQIYTSLLCNSIISRWAPQRTGIQAH